MEKLARAHVLCCGGTGCSSSGSREIISALREKLAARGMSDEVKVVETGCHGLCELGPLVIVYPEGVFYTRVQVSDADEIVETHLVKGRVIERLLFKEPTTLASVPDYDDIAFYKKQQRYALINCGHIDPESMEEYIGAEGYEGLAKALSMTPEDVIAEIKKSGLRGRGGGGFPTGNKWQFTRNAVGDKKYVICNADEGDPGAFMDRSVLEGDPHRVLEGMTICGYAVGSDEGYIYCRAEYPLAIKRLQRAIKQATDAGLLGENILGSGFGFNIHIKEGAGAFVCGEETALLASIEGRRGMPRPRPPFPANSGLWGKPTNINNVETFANIPSIMRDGGDYFASWGTETSKGTKVFALTGKINNTGLAEVPMGITMREIIYDIGGGIPDGKKFKAVQIGGPSGGCLPEQLLDLAIDYESLTKAGAMMGSGGLVVMDETTCMVDVARYFLNFTQDESCGKCTPCREGTKRMLEILNRICDGKGVEDDIPLLESLAQSIKEGSLCALGQTAPNPVLSTLSFFRHEYEAHIRDHKCPAGVCTAFVGYTINDNCRGCGLCKKACPVAAISGAVKSKHAIDPEKCVKCGACQAKCPFKAIDKG
ncbi:MAG: NADH-quinone oxidoreductase subunit NuoF [Synergistaceae bacterium]|jgi:NADH-quinone oxidoreductase subunit F/NADP-reducing hydrogenase subunit HndC|nr:NADH-quinone oxidoreductase subunit NuoF [Synergistaceae bacterium]